MIEYRENTKYKINALNMPLQQICPYTEDDDIRLPVSFYTPNPHAFLNSERDKHAKGKNMLPIWTEFYGSLCDCSLTRYLTILPRLISVSCCQVLQEILLVFVQQNFLNNMPTFYESAFFM